MDVLASVVMESIGRQVGNSEVKVRSISTLNAVDFISVRDSDASTEVSIVVVVLGVKIELSFVQGVVLLLPEEGVFEDAWLLIPPVNASTVLLQDEVYWRIFIVVIKYSISDVGPKHVSVQRNEELSGIVCIVGIGKFKSCWPKSKRIIGYD